MHKFLNHSILVYTIVYRRYVSYISSDLGMPMDAFRKLQVQHEFGPDRLQGSKALPRDLWAQLQQLHIKGAQGLHTTQ